MEETEIRERLHKLADALNANNIATAELHATSKLIHSLLKDIKDDVDNLNKHLFHGNGQPAVVVRLAKVESDHVNLRSSIDKISDDLEDFDASKLNRNFIICTVGVVLLWGTLIFDYAYSSDLAKTLIGVFK